MAKHLPFNEFDMAGITSTVNKYKEAGLRSDYDVSEKAAGIVKIALENPIKADGSFAIFEVHKLARPGWLRDKPWWVVQLWHRGNRSDTSEKRGCVAAKGQAYALSAAEKDLRFNFMSVCDFELAAQS